MSSKFYRTDSENRSNFLKYSRTYLIQTYRMYTAWTDKVYVEIFTVSLYKEFVKSSLFATLLTSGNSINF